MSFGEKLVLPVFFLLIKIEGGGVALEQLAASSHYEARASAMEA